MLALGVLALHLRPELNQQSTAWQSEALPLHHRELQVEDGINFCSSCSFFFLFLFLQLLLLFSLFESRMYFLLQLSFLVSLCFETMCLFSFLLTTILVTLLQRCNAELTFAMALNVAPCRSAGWPPLLTLTPTRYSPVKMWKMFTAD